MHLAYSIGSTECSCLARGRDFRCKMVVLNAVFQSNLVVVVTSFHVFSSLKTATKSRQRSLSSTETLELHATRQTHEQTHTDKNERTRKQRTHQETTNTPGNKINHVLKVRTKNERKKRRKSNEGRKEGRK